VQRYASLVGEKNKSNEVATLQAASLLMMHVPQTDPRWAPLEGRTRALVDSKDMPPMAKYLANIVDESVFFTSATKTSNHSDIEYFAGVKDVSTNNYQRALPMMIAASFAGDDYPPAGWALKQLYDWNDGHRPWQTIGRTQAVTAAP
jgi:hypothetical protein